MVGESGKWRIAHLTASPFLGGPERQMLGLAGAMPEAYCSTFLCLMEGGRAQPFVDELQRSGVGAVCLRSNHPRLVAAVREVARTLRGLGADVLLTHGYKADIIGLAAARMARIPVIMVSRGWTYATRKVRFYEMVDRVVLRRADHVVCVSEGQARKVRAAGVPGGRVTVIHNSIDTGRFGVVDGAGRESLRELLSGEVRHIVLAVGRLSPEKGFGRLVEAAALVCEQRRDIGFVLVGEGPIREELQQQIQSLNLPDRFVLVGFRRDVDRLLPHAMCLVQSSYTEGMPNVVLEAMAGGIPVVATDVGGTAEVVMDGKTGLLVPAGDAEAIARGILCLAADGSLRKTMGVAGRERVEERFAFASQAEAYAKLFQKLLPCHGAVHTGTVAQAAQVPGA